MKFLECTDIARKHNAALRCKEKIAVWAHNLKMVALAVAGFAGAVVLYGMMWLGAFLDYVAGV